MPDVNRAHPDMIYAIASGICMRPCALVYRQILYQ